MRTNSNCFTSGDQLFFLHGYCYTGDETFNVLFLKFGGPTGTETGGRLPDPIVFAVYASLRDVQYVEPGRDGIMIQSFSQGTVNQMYHLHVTRYASTVHQLH